MRIPGGSVLRSMESMTRMLWKLSVPVVVDTNSGVVNPRTTSNRESVHQRIGIGVHDGSEYAAARCQIWPVYVRLPGRQVDHRGDSIRRRSCGKNDPAHLYLHGGLIHLFTKCKARLCGDAAARVLWEAVWKGARGSKVSCGWPRKPAQFYVAETMHVTADLSCLLCARVRAAADVIWKYKESGLDVADRHHLVQCPDGIIPFSRQILMHEVSLVAQIN